MEGGNEGKGRTGLRTGGQPRRRSTISRLDIYDWLLANDPALSRLRLAARVTLSVVLSCLILLGVHLLLAPLPAAAYGLGILLSIQGGVAVRDNGMKAQFVTRLLGCGASIVVVAIAALLEPYRFLADFVFLLIVFLASAARIYGPRGHAVGMFAFLSYFMGAYFHPPLNELALVAAGPVVSSLVSQTVRAVLLPDDWRRDLLRALEGVNSRVNRILFRLAAIAAAGHIDEEDHDRLLRLEERLKDAVLMAQGLIPRPEGGLFQEGKGPAADLAILLFDLHLAAESAIILSQQTPPTVAAIAAVLRARSTEHISEGQSDPGDADAAWTLRRLTETKALLIAAIEDGRRTAFRHIETEAASPAAQKLDFTWRNPVFQKTVQITLAAALAMIFGLLLSRERWFWAVVASFLVFVNTTSRGDTAMKALQRSLGTILGIVVGLLLASLVHGWLLLAIPMSVACIFLAFYFLQISYATMTFFVSITLCLVYGMTGRLTLDLLLLRMEETAIGAVAGGLVAFFVFPSKTRGIVDKALATWFGALRELLEAIEAGKPRYVLVGLSQKLDAAYRELTAAVQPLGSSWSVVTRPGHIRQGLAIFLSCTYWARLAARTYTFEKADKGMADAILAHLDAAADKGADCFFVDRKSHGPAPLHGSPSQGGARLALEMIGTTLVRLYPEV